MVYDEWEGYFLKKCYVTPLLAYTWMFTSPLTLTEVACLIILD